VTAPDPKSERLQATHDFKCKAILKAARAVFAREGKSGLTIRAVAAEAGYAAGAVYSYFGSKDEIAAQLIAEDLAALAKRLKDTDAPMQNIDATRRLGRLAAETFRALSAEANLVVLAGDALANDALPSEVDRLLNGKLIAALMALGSPMQNGDTDKEDARLATVATAALVLGTAMLERSGRLEVLGVEPDVLLSHAVERLSKSA
jgi:AcrR family transcriptional regulator